MKSLGSVLEGLMPKITEANGTGRPFEYEPQPEPDAKPDVRFCGLCHCEIWRGEPIVGDPPAHAECAGNQEQPNFSTTRRDEWR